MEVLPASLLTPLLYAATACASLVLARLWGAPSMSRATALALLLLPLCLTGQALLSGQVYAPVDMALEHAPLSAAEGARAHNQFAGDIAFQIIPWHHAVREAWAMGEWPLWNPSLLAGDVLAAAAQPAPYHPVNILALLLPLDLALTYLASLFLFYAGLCAFLYARDLGCRDESALVAAIGWQFSSFVVFWLLWPMGLTAAFLPLVFFSVRRLAWAPTPQHIGGLALSFVLILLAGHPESVLYIVAAGGVYGAWEVCSAYRQDRPGAFSWRPFAAHLRSPLIAAVAAGLLALAISAIFLLPLLDALPDTAQYSLRRAQFAQDDHSVPLRQAMGRLRASLIPFVHGVTWDPDGHASVPGFFVPPSSAYLGSILLAPMLFGLWRHPWRGRWLLAAFAVFGCLAGAAFPGVTHAIAALPIFDISIHKRWVFVAAFAVAILAGLGAEAWAARPDRRARRELLALHGVVLLGLASLLAQSWAGMLRSGLSAEFLLPRCLALFLPVLLSAALFASQRGTTTTLILFAALLTAQRSAEAGDRYPTLERASFYPEPEILRAIPRNDRPFRMVALGDLLSPNIAGLYGLEDVRGYEPMASKRFVDTYRIWTDRVDVYFNRVESLNAPFLDFLGIRYALAPAGYESPQDWRLLASEDGIQLLENTRAADRAFVPDFVQLERSSGAMWHQMKNATDFHREAWIHPMGLAEDELGQPGSGFRQRNGSGTVAIEPKGLGFEIEAQMHKAGWIVTSIPAWRGWRVQQAGDSQAQEVPLFYANHAFLAFRLDAGEHQLTLRYLPSSFVVGKVISAAAVFLTLLWGSWAWWRARRHR